MMSLERPNCYDQIDTEKIFIEFLREIQSNKKGMS